MNDKHKIRIINIIIVVLLIFMGIGWYNGFEGWGGQIALWIALIFSILFIIALFTRD